MAGGKAAAKAGEEVAGGFLKKMLGKLIRPAEKITGKAGAKDAAKDAAKLAERDKALRDAMDTNVRDLRKHDLVDKAARERDALREKLSGMSKSERKEWLRNRDEVPRSPSKRGPDVVTGATDPETGISRAGVNHSSDKAFPYGGCAEDDALDQINAARRARDPEARDLERHEVVYSQAHEVDTGRQREVCDRNCQEKSDPGQYEYGTQHRRGGRWDNPDRTNIDGRIW